MSQKIVIVGGVAAGMSFATRYRRLNETAEITVIEKGPYVSFANCGLPYHISEVISDRDELLVVDEIDLKQHFNLNILTNHEVIKIEPNQQEVIIKNLNQEFNLSYDKLILATGAKPIQLDIPGLKDHPGAFTLRDIPDMDKIINYLKQHRPQSAVVIGGGFIGLEMVENLKHLDLTVSLVEMAPQVLLPFDEEMALFAELTLKEHGVTIFTNNHVVKLADKKAYLNNGEVIDADLLIMAVGVLPESNLAQEAGIKTGFKNGIVVDEKFQTSHKNIYAIGDVALVSHRITQEPVLIPLASPANRQGRQLADILSGHQKVYRGSLGTSILKLFNNTFASTGLNQRQLQDYETKAVYLFANHHVSYYPGAKEIALKVIFNPETETIYGAQAVGEAGVDKRIDVLATAIIAGMKVTDLQELELAYAPPFGAAKDIINYVGYVAENVLNETTKQLPFQDLKSALKNGYQLVDTRKPAEILKTGQIENSLEIPLGKLRENLHNLDKTKPVIVYCYSGGRSFNAERLLRQAGFEVYNLAGSFALQLLFNLTKGSDEIEMQS